MLHNLVKKDFVFKNPDLGSTKYEGVLYNQHTKYLTEINLNMPKKFNSLDLKMIRSMLKKVRQWIPYNIDGFSSEGEFSQEKNAVPKVAVFTGNGKAFSAGGDIVELYNAKMKDPNAKILKDFFRYEFLLDYSITRMLPIQVALWHGAVMGGGVGISINSPFKICTDSTIFAMPESKIGLFTDVGASWFLPRILNNSPELGLFIGLTGERIRGKDLAVTGIATHYVAQEKFDKIKDILISNIDEKINKEKLYDLVSENCDYTFDKNKFVYPNYEKILYTFQLDSLENIFQRLENLIESNKDKISSELKDQSNLENLVSDTSRDWAIKVKKNLTSQSPLSLSVILELLKRGTQLDSIDEAYDMEIQVMNGFMEDSDFFEGVRALLVEKDNKPVWKHGSYKEINHEDMVKQYFERSEEIDVDQNLEN